MFTDQTTDVVVSGIFKRCNGREERETWGRTQLQFKHLFLGSHDGKVLQMNQGSKLRDKAETRQSAQPRYHGE